MGVLVVIPARYGSTRFPGKPLATLHGRPVIQHVYERVAQAERVEETVIATDDERIVEAVRQFGGEAVMTSPQARSGTERVAEVARTRSAQIVINVQGDEPLVHPDMVDSVAAFLERHKAVPMASVMRRIERCEDIANPHIVKVVVDREGFALYFSRGPIPWVRQDEDPRAGGPHEALKVMGAMKHIGLYGYQRRFVMQFPHLEPTPLEQFEQLEQLRALEHGYRIKLLETEHDTIGVDTPEDLARVEAWLAKSGSPLKVER